MISGLLFGRFEVFPCVFADGAGVICRQFTVTGFKVAADGADVTLLLLFDDWYHMFKLFLAVFAERAYEVIGHVGTFMDITAHTADPAFFLFGSGILLGLDMGMVVGIGAGRRLGENLRLDNIGDKQDGGIQVLHGNHFTGEDGIRIFRDIADSVCGALGPGDLQLAVGFVVARCSS